MRNLASIFLIVWILLPLNSFASNLTNTGFYSSPIEPDPEEEIKPTKESDSNNKDIAFVEKMEVSIDELKSLIEELNESDKSDYFTEQLINVAKDFQGVKYKFGGVSRSGMDCSGFVLTAFKAFDITLPRTSISMSSVGKKVKSSEAQKGDLIFFKGRKHSRIGHVGIITKVEGDEINFIHSSSTKGVVISSLKEPYYSKKFAQINRVYDKQLL